MSKDSRGVTGSVVTRLCEWRGRTVGYEGSFVNVAYASATVRLCGLTFGNAHIIINSRE